MSIFIFNVRRLCNTDQNSQKHFDETETFRFVYHAMKKELGREDENVEKRDRNV